jgi:hypothetical protein
MIRMRRERDGQDMQHVWERWEMYTNGNENSEYLGVDDRITLEWILGK